MRCEILIGPPNVATPWIRLYDGFGVSCPVSENDRASSAVLSRITPIPPLYCPRPLRRLLPNAAICANGDDAPLLTLPLIRKLSAVSELGSTAGASAFFGAAGLSCDSGAFASAVGAGVGTAGRDTIVAA